MAVDERYGRVTLEHGNVGEDEPVYVLRANDRLAPTVLRHYLALGARSGYSHDHRVTTLAAIEKIERWQAQNLRRWPRAGPLSGVVGFVRDLVGRC